jgi:4'-phosphopantetheinyl transferase EntD
MTLCIGHYRPWRKHAASVTLAPSKNRAAPVKLSGAMNTASLSIRLGSLFPAGAAAAELREPGDPLLLLPGEAAHLGRAVEKRVREFAAGRLCARRALAEFGIVDFPIKVADDRQPVWPASMVGSITHTAGFCGAVAAERRSLGALGLDSEVVGAVNLEIWPMICVPVETAWLDSLPESQRAAAITLIFSAKEAFYKCQYPVVRESLSFHDVTVAPMEWGAAGGVFEIHATRGIAIAKRTALPLRGRYLFHEEFVTAGMGLPAAAVS